MPSPFIGNLHPSVKGFRSLPPTSSCLDAPPEPHVPVSPFTLLIFVSGGYWLTPTLSCRFWQSGYLPTDYLTFKEPTYYFSLSLLYYILYIIYPFYRKVKYFFKIIKIIFRP